MPAAFPFWIAVLILCTKYLFDLFSPVFSINFLPISEIHDPILLNNIVDLIERIYVSVLQETSLLIVKLTPIPIHFVMI